MPILHLSDGTSRNAWYQVWDHWQQPGYRLILGDDNGGVEAGDHRVFRTIRAATAYCVQQFGERPVRVR